MTTPGVPAAPSPKPRRRWRTWFLALVIFLGGGAVGAGLTAITIFHGIRHALMHPEEAPTRVAARLKRPLDLSPQQSEQIEAIVATRQKSLMRIRRQVQPEIEQELAGLESEIAGVLNPAQQQKWHVMVGRIRENWLPPIVGESATSHPKTLP